MDNMCKANAIRGKLREPRQFNPPIPCSADSRLSQPKTASEFLIEEYTRTYGKDADLSYATLEEFRNNPNEIENVLLTLTTVSYDTVFSLLSTPGNYIRHPHWVSHVCALLKVGASRTIVAPGDWIVEVYPGCLIAVSDADYKEYFLDRTAEVHLPVFLPEEV